jgi:ubiquinone/menaquinone biosynthesis C-methylase UbiE
MYERKMIEDRARFARKANIKSGSKVLDMGTGHGLFATCIAREVGRSGLVIAIDVSSEHVKQTKMLFKKEQLSDFAHIIKADLRWIPISTNRLDAVMSYNFLCSINAPSDLSKVFFEARRILRNNGKIIAIDHFSKARDKHESLFFRRFDVYKDIYMYTGNSLHLTWFSTQEIKTLLEALGFAVKIEIVERDIWMPRSVLKKEIYDLIQKIKQRSINQKMTLQLIDKLRELHRETKEQGIKIPPAILVTANFKNTNQKPRI